jgi:hypothetical protein
MTQLTRLSLSLDIVRARDFGEQCGGLCNLRSLSLSAFYTAVAPEADMPQVAGALASALAGMTQVTSLSIVDKALQAHEQASVLLEALPALAAAELDLR